MNLIKKHEVVAMKKIILFICLISVLFVSACNKTKPIDIKTIDELLQGLSIETNVMTVTSVFYDNQFKMDIVESINMNHSNGIHLHLIISGENTSMERDVQVLITQGYVYTTEGMKKMAHQMDLTDHDILWQFINQYFVYIQKDLYTSNDIHELGQSLIHPTLGKLANSKKLRGQDPNQSEVLENQVRMIEICFSSSRILEVHLRTESLFESTKDKNNYIYGTHYYFGEPPYEDFPNLTLFN